MFPINEDSSNGVLIKGETQSLNSNVIELLNPNELSKTKAPLGVNEKTWEKERVRELLKVNYRKLIIKN